MARKNWAGLLVAGVLITMTIASTACSSQSTNEAVLPDSEDVKRSIIVYESPT